jgi:hypothetical protein
MTAVGPSRTPGSRTPGSEKPTGAPDDLIPITVNDLRRLFDALVMGQTSTVEHILNWSLWRPNHQATARRCRYHRRTEDADLTLRLSPSWAPSRSADADAEARTVNGAAVPSVVLAA